MSERLSPERLMIDANDGLDRLRNGPRGCDGCGSHNTAEGCCEDCPVEMAAAALRSGVAEVQRLQADAPISVAGEAMVGLGYQDGFRAGVEAGASLVDGEGCTDPDCECSNCAMLGRVAYDIRDLTPPEEMPDV